MCEGGFNALERIAHQAAHRFEQEQEFLLAWAHEAEHQGDERAIEVFRRASEALDGAIAALQRLEVAQVHHEPTITRIA